MILEDQLRSKSVFVSKTTTNQQLSNQELSTQQQILKQPQLSEGPQHLDRLTTLMNTPGCSDQTPNQFSGKGRHTRTIVFLIVNPLRELLKIYLNLT